MYYTNIIRRTRRLLIFNPISQIFNLEIASSKLDSKFKKSPNLTSLIVCPTLELPITENFNLSFLHSFAVWTSAPRPEESKKSILDKSIMNGNGFSSRFPVTKVLNCFSEKASSWPVKLKIIIFVFTVTLPLKETVSLWKSSMV